MDQQEEVIEEVDLVNTSLIGYAGKTLDEWQDELRVVMPDMPCSSIDIDKTCAKLNNKYQIAYNMYNNLLVAYKELESRVNRLIIEKSEELSAEYAKNKVKAPGRERLENIARVKFDIIGRHERKLIETAILKVYFENHKNKLKDMMLLTNSLSYSVNQSDRMFDKSRHTNGM